MAQRSVVAAVAVATLGAMTFTGGTLAQAAPAQVRAAAKSSGTFKTVVYLPNVVSSAVADPTAVAIGDVTGDGRADLVTTTVNRDNINGGTTIAVYPQGSTGKLGKPITLKAKDINDLGTRVTISDLYHNGHKDVLLAEPSGVDIFTVSTTKISGPTRVSVGVNGAFDLAVTDFNGDGHPDLLISTGDHLTTKIYTGSSAHKFTLWRTETFPAPTAVCASCETVRAADINHDGREDIVYYNGARPIVRLQTSSHTFGTAKAYALNPGDAQNFDIAVGDVSGDGHTDVLADAWGDTSMGIDVFVAGSTGTLKAAKFYSTANTPGAMTVADVNGDGRKDVVISHVDGLAIGVMIQQSNGVLGSEASYPVTDCCGFGPDQPAVGDLNGDGKPDIAVAAGEVGIGILYGK